MTGEKVIIYWKVNVGKSAVERVSHVACYEYIYSGYYASYINYLLNMYAFEGMPPSDLLQVSILYILANFREKVAERTGILLNSSIKPMNISISSL